jgi:hypothetical protein
MARILKPVPFGAGVTFVTSASGYYFTLSKGLILFGNDFLWGQTGGGGWQKAVGYGKRSLGETAMFRYKTLIGPTLRARTLTRQKTEARLACFVINRMTELGRPIWRRVP